MTAVVRAKVDLFNTTSNTLEVPRHSKGTVTDFQVGPYPENWHIDFTINQSTVSRWVTPDQIVWEDGSIGPVKAVLELTTQSVTKVTHPRVLSDKDLIIGRQLTAYQSLVRWEFSGGLIIDMESDINTGKFKFTFVAS